jgi:hypothetical protein
MSEFVFKVKGYLEKSYTDKEGGWHHSFEFSVKEAQEHAKLVLMGRDLKNHQPVLLEIKVKQAHKGESKY